MPVTKARADMTPRIPVSKAGLSLHLTRSIVHILEICLCLMRLH